MKVQQHVDARDAAIGQAVADKAGATVSLRQVSAALLAFALPVAIGSLTMLAV